MSGASPIHCVKVPPKPTAQAAYQTPTHASSKPSPPAQPTRHRVEQTTENFPPQTHTPYHKHSEVNKALTTLQILILLGALVMGFRAGYEPAPPGPQRFFSW